MIDSGCSQSIAAGWVAQARGGRSSILAIDGGAVTARGTAEVEMQVKDITVKLKCLIVNRIVGGIDAILGQDFIVQVGGVAIMGNEVMFGVWQRLVSGIGATAVSTMPSPLSVSDPDFSAEFDGAAWTVSWKWREGQPHELRNMMGCYNSTRAEETKEKFAEEVDRWIAEGWLQPCANSEKGGVLPLMAVVQSTKGKVRPVLDFRELNEHVSSHPGVDAAVCSETLRRWRRMPGATKIVDLKSAYLQVRVDRELWRHQQVSYNGRRYMLTRLGFGLNCAPKIMSTIVKLVLAQDSRVQAGTDSYIDDIVVDEDVVSADEVVEHLRRYGLEAKPPEALEGGRVLGLAISRDVDGKLMFGRGNVVPHLEEGKKVTRRQLFSICGQLVGHYPICGWLRVACSYVKRESAGERWEEWIGEKAQRMLAEVIRRVQEEDPVKGFFRVEDATAGRVWCDASSLALGVVMEIGGKIVEDMSWLRKPNDATHINVAELDAVVKGLTMAMKWGLTAVEIMTDSATVLSWLTSILVDDCRVKVTGMSEMLVRRRLGVVQDMAKEYQLQLSVKYVQSSRNRADALTRVSKEWLKKTGLEVCGVSVAALHAQHHFGVDRTLHLARMVSPSVSREEVEQCVRTCLQCQSVDPAPERHVQGHLEVAQSWSRLAIDVTHLGRWSYLTLVDCGPGRFAIWRKVESENGSEIGSHLDEIFRERGPPDEVLMDNSTAFRSKCVEDVCSGWGVRRRYRAAYRPSGNGIVERHHRTIKARSVRTGADPLQVVFWYNLAAKDGLKGESAPCSNVFRYQWRHPLAPPVSEEESESRFQVGDRVWVKPPAGLCTSRWTEGRVTGVTSGNNVSVNGMPRHVLDLRKIVDEEDEGKDRVVVPREDEEPRSLVGLRALFADVGEVDVVLEETAGMVTEEPDSGCEAATLSELRPARSTRAPAWLADYVVS